MSNEIIEDENDQDLKQHLADMYTTGYNAGVEAELKSVEKLREYVKKVIQVNSYPAASGDYAHGNHTAANMILDEINELWSQNNSV